MNGSDTVPSLISHMTGTTETASLELPEVDQPEPLKEDSKAQTVETPDSGRLDMEGALVDMALQNVMTLPLAVKEVHHQQQIQNTDLICHQRELHAVKEESETAKSQLNDTEQEIACVKRQLFLVEEANIEKQHQCTKLMKDILSCLSETEVLKNEAEAKSNALDKQMETFAGYFSKIYAHKELVSGWQQNRAQYKVLQEKKQALEKLKYQYEC